MIHISDAEFVRLSRSGRLVIPIAMQDSVRDKLDAVLSYAEQLKTVLQQTVQHAAIDGTVTMQLRADQRRDSIAAPLLVLAPQREDRYFVVPVVIAHD